MTADAHPNDSLFEKARLPRAKTLYISQSGPQFVADAATRLAFETIAADIKGCTYVSGGPGPLFEAGWNACLEMLAKRYAIPDAERN